MKDFEELLKELEKRLEEQTEQHDGGNYWIGRGGTSPFGHSGNHPDGIGSGVSPRGRHTDSCGEEVPQLSRRHTLDVRQIKMALKRLRQLTRIGPEDELDLDRTIDSTAKNAGDIDMNWMRSRKNAVKLLLPDGRGRFHGAFRRNFRAALLGGQHQFAFQRPAILLLSQLCLRDPPPGHRGEARRDEHGVPAAHSGAGLQGSPGW